MFMVAGFGSVFAGRANAIQHCWDLPSPNATRFLGPGPGDVLSVSDSGTYSKGGCHYWVVDISVPSNSSGGIEFLPAFSINFSGVPTTKTSCLAYQDYLVVFVKHQGQPQFDSTPIARGSRKGSWHPGNFFGPCTLTLSANNKNSGKPLSPPADGTDVYRVAAAIKSGNTWKIVRVTAAHLRKPPIIN
jgi:hypothetical protein